MKVVHLNITGNYQSQPLSYAEHINLATELEQDNEIDEAINVYMQCRLLHPKDEYTYDRLMFLYHKKKEYQKELEIIQEGISRFDNRVHAASSMNNNPGVIGKVLNTAVSFILKRTGVDYGSSFRPQPVLKWHKRAILLQRRISTN